MKETHFKTVLYVENKHGIHYLTKMACDEFQNWKLDYTSNIDYAIDFTKFDPFYFNKALELNGNLKVGVQEVLVKKKRWFS